MKVSLSKIYTYSKGLALAMTLAFMPLASFAEEEISLVDGLAVHGYDVVSYFVEGKPVEGSAEFTATHEGATYQFSSAENRDKFEQNPVAYVPQYGGYCAFGTAMGRKFDGDPNAWSIVDDKLYLNINQNVQARWSENIPGFIAGAENNWPIIESVSDSTLESNPPEGLTAGAL